MQRSSIFTSEPTLRSLREPHEKQKKTLAVRPLAYFNAVCFNEGHLLCDALFSTLASDVTHLSEVTFFVAPLLLLSFSFFFTANCLDKDSENDNLTHTTALTPN